MTTHTSHIAIIGGGAAGFFAAMTSIPGTKFKAQGPLLITHWGMSGPAVLKLSSHAARHLHENNYQLKVSVNWISETNRSLVEENIRGIIAANPQKQLASIRPYNLPTRLWLYLIQKMGYVAEKKWSEMGKKGCKPHNLATRHKKLPTRAALKPNSCGSFIILHESCA